ncbi:MAG: polysaccharide pyruvyl transferase family protein, partial [Oscillospiraceae bacterium]
LFTSDICSDRQFKLERLVELKQQRVPFDKKNPKHIMAMGFRKVFKKENLYIDTFFKGKVDNIKNSICVSIGGDMYCYGNLSWLYYTHSVLKKNNNKTILWGCSVDESSFKYNSFTDLKRYDYIFTRESLSYQLFKKYGFNNVKLFPDPAFCLQKQQADIGMDIDLSNTVAINVSPLLNRYKGEVSPEDALLKLVDYILNNTLYNILFIPHVNGNNFAEDDFSYLKDITQKINNSRVFLLDKKYNCSEMKYFVSMCKFLVTARTHLSIAAYSTCVPTVVLGYSIKARGIAKDIFGTEKNYVVPIQNMKNDTELIDAFEWLMQNENQ